MVNQSNALNIPVTVCGEFAGEPGGALLLMAMGYRKLSMSPHNLRKIKWVIRNVDLKEAELVMAEALSCDTPAQVLELLSLYLEKNGIGGLVRAGS